MTSGPDGFSQGPGLPCRALRADARTTNDFNGWRQMLPGTQNEYESVTFGEDEQPVVGVHADVMVFTVTA
jgi:hypothetical protein